MQPKMLGLLEQIQKLTEDATETAGFNPDSPKECALVFSYLIGGLSLKTLRAEVKQMRAEELLHQKPHHQLTWFKVDGGWEAVSAACAELGDHFGWRVEKVGSFWYDDSSAELGVKTANQVGFKTLDEAKKQYQIWEDQLISEANQKTTNP